MYLQILVSLSIVFILYKLFRQRQDGKLSNSAFVIWFLLWLAVLLVFWQPEITSYLANILGIGRGADLVVYLSILVIFYIIFKIYVRLSKIESQLTKIVRKDAIDNAKER